MSTGDKFWKTRRFTEVSELVKRRATMDVKLDIRNSTLWGEEEIDNDFEEIAKKIKVTIEFLTQRNTDYPAHVINADPYNYIGIWQKTYRTEKRFYIMATHDKRVSKDGTGTMVLEDALNLQF